MSEKNLLKKFYQFLCKDTGERNQSGKLVTVVRMLLLTMLVYSLANSVLFFLASHTNGMIYCLVFFAVFLAVFGLSYRCHSMVSFCILNLCTLIWVTTNVSMFGWNIGVQTFLFVLLIFCFFAKYRHTAAKFSYVAALLLLRMFLYYHFQNNGSSIDISRGLNDAFQIVNSIAIFLSLSIIAYFFSTDTQALEGKLVEYNEQLKKQASIDPLTGLHNRRSTMEYLEQLLPGAQDPISICLCDIDFFKKVNDTYGHNTGDLVLQKLSETFGGELPSNSFISRWGGEEFLLIFPHSNGDDAYISLSALRNKIKSIPFDGGNGAVFSVSMTFGLVEYDFHSDLSAILKQADEKLYLGKENGRDRIVF